ncbi:DUF2510 domain-containing protein, partial [Streptomyces sp. NPDC005568]|uniref:DUF2510 domain-containing protein n=1 Tax=Streptomyces sp. NPDC005568 TaxID=3156887 RepID=UPI0033AFBBCF
MTTHSNTPAGWYPDPQGAAQTLRYWDGSQWTQHTNTDQQGQSTPQVPQQAQSCVPDGFSRAGHVELIERCMS